MDLLRAVWLSRQGRIDDSLDALDRARASGFAIISFDIWVAEILLRPLWLGAVGRTVSDRTIRRVRADPGPGRSDTHDVWTAMRVDDPRGALRAAARWRQEKPSELLWSLAELELSRALGDRTALGHVQVRCRALWRYYTANHWALRELRENAAE